MNRIIVGIDEAGRGPLAGRVYAAAVILKDIKIDGLNDSKKLSELKREKLFDIIIKNSISYSIAYATHEEIDDINILQASILAMRRTLDSIQEEYNYILVDGNKFPFSQQNGEAIIKGDTKIEEIMAASILAKVSRDRYMLDMHLKYPEYKFNLHKGYPTKEHRQLIAKYGVCEIHRKTFKGVKEYLI